MKRALALLAQLALAGCATMPPPMMPPPPPVIAGSASATVGFGGRVVLYGLTIVPLRVVEDSRCPINARCIWAGRLILRTEFAAGGPLKPRDFVLGTPWQVQGGILTLIAAEPGKLAGAGGSPPADRFTFELTR